MRSAGWWWFVVVLALGVRSRGGLFFLGGSEVVLVVSSCFEALLVGISSVICFCWYGFLLRVFVIKFVLEFCFV